jgi:hypothetical protein
MPEPFSSRTFGVATVKTQVDLDPIRLGFRGVPTDGYVSDGTRCKDIWRCEMSRGRVVSTPLAPLFYAEHAEAYGQISSRTYAEIPVAETAHLSDLVKIFARTLRIAEKREFLIQRQRVIIRDDGLAPTVREGVHRDGVEWLAMLCVARTNIRGGISRVYDRAGNSGVGGLVFAGTLEPGDMLFLDDTRLLHDATPIRRVDPGLAGSRDMILITYPACREAPAVGAAPSAAELSRCRNRSAP